MKKIKQKAKFFFLILKELFLVSFVFIFTPEQLNFTPFSLTLQGIQENPGQLSGLIFKFCFMEYN
jgi:hypothetical protein